MPSLHYGLNLTKKKGTTGAAPAAARKTIFDDGVDDEDGADPTATGEGEAEALTTFGGLTSEDSRPSQPVTKKGPATSQSGAPTRKPHGPPSRNLAAAHVAAQHAAEAQQLDSTVYDYDGVYDSLHAADASKKRPSGSNNANGPRYMHALREAADVRQRDSIRAKETMLQKEREAEGEQYADKESFVTGAYKAQQAELQRLEEEERRKEEADAERQRRMGGGMTAFYQKRMAREEARHQAAIRAVQEQASKPQQKGDEALSQPEDRENDEAKQARKMGAVLNEDGQVVDKRQLLQAGLNVKAKPKPPLSSAERTSSTAAAQPSASSAILSGRASASKMAMRERQSRMLEEQLADAAKRAAEVEDQGQEALQRAAKSRKTTSEISSARERYLQRRKEAEAAKAAGKGE